MKNFIHKIRGRLLFLQLLLLTILHSPLTTQCQTRVTGALSGPGTLGAYFNYNHASVILSPGFTSTPGSGQSFQAYITTVFSPISLNLTRSQNYVLTSVPRISGITDTASLSGLTADELMQTVQYFDGIGRPLQTVQVEGSANGYDVVQPFIYDAFGREAVKYLPYAASTFDGSFKASAVSAQGTFYSSPPTGVSANAYPKAITTFEVSPLNRPVSQGAPGGPWQPDSGHTVTTAYAVNAVSDSVILWTISSGGNGATAGSYSANTLYKTTVTDENGHSTYSYTDMLGHMVCKKVSLGSTLLATYYVYDDLNNLAYVIPPIPAGTTYPTSFTETSTVFLNFIYGYHYDQRNRQVKKKIPGKGWEYTVYNTLDQVVATQDSVQRASNVWTITKYDIQGRVLVVSLWNNGNTAITRDSLQHTVNAFTGQLWENRPIGSGRTNLAWPTSAPTANLVVNFYDDYTFPGNPYSSSGGSISNPTGMLTANKTVVLSPNGTYTQQLWTVPYYDDRGRNIQTFKQHYLGGGTASTNNYDNLLTTYNFDNQAATTTRYHNVAGTQTLGVSNAFYYDHMGRRFQNYEAIQIGSSSPLPTVLLSDVEFNEIGQVMTKHLHEPSGSSSFLQDIAYTYNERGWLRTGASSLFSLDLRYNTPGAGTANFNGNIAEMHYAGAHSSKVFDYTYDALNRLTYANSNSGGLDETLAYDYLGNITTLNRGGVSYGTLSYAYTGNQLTGVTGTGFTTRSYAYDGNGNATSDGINKTIKYNMLNLPDSLVQSGTGIANYTYDAAGTKLRTTSAADSTWDYVNGIVYRNGSIAYVQTEEGRAINEGSTYAYQYDLKDHLGNNRVVFDSNSGTARELQEDEYYAFGLRQNLFGSNNGNRYLYNGKEIQMDLANQYDYGARFYDPVIARWTSVDPKAEKSRRWSPYNYVENDPIRLTDPDGMEAEWLKGKNAKVNGGKATYTVNKDGTLKWTNATKATKELGNNLAAHGGEKDLKAAVDSKHEIDLNHSAGKGPGDRLGQTATFPDKAGSTTAAKSEVTIYQGSIDAQQSRLANEQSWEPNQIKTYEDEKSALYQALSQLGDADAALAGVTDHELFHATDQQNIHDSLSNSSNDVEVGPTTRENGILKAAVVKDVMNIVKSFIP